MPWRARGSQQSSKRVAATDEIAAAALWLASESAFYIVGQNIVIDGGTST
ncbi:SDR family oxidoreductase [Paracoccus aerodenitrificans]